MSLPPSDTDERSVDDEQFTGSSVDRRTFLSLSAAVGVALSVPTSATAQVSADALTDRAEYVVNHTPDHYRAPLVVEFDSASAADEFDSTFEFSEEDRRGPTGEDLPRPEKTVVRDDPTPAGHGLLTTEEVETLVGMDGVNRVDFSPGSNPFWVLDDEPYADRVFPDVEEARNYLDYEETVAGLDHLESEHPDMLNVEQLGRESPGWQNLFLEEPERYPIYAAQVTNDVQDEQSFAEKNKVVYTVSIHGDEPQGREAGTRVIEDVLRGEAPEFEAQLDDVVLVFLFINPDGWMARRPMTELEHEEEIEFGEGSFLRGNGSYVEESWGMSQLDTNRQYPTIGWTNPGFYPAEPEGYPEFFEELVPDALAAVEHFRDYENVEFLCDYHGMGISTHMVFHLETNAPFDHRRTHDLDEVSIRSGEGMIDEWGDIANIEGDIVTAIAEHFNIDLDEAAQYAPQGEQFNGFLDYGTIYDMLNYQVTGAFLGWAGSPEEQGGLGAITVAPEMMHSNPDGNTFLNWKPYWSRHQVLAYRTSMREYAELAGADTDATVETGGTQTAFVETEELTRSSADLPHTGDSVAAQSTGGTQVRRGSDQLSTQSTESALSMDSVEETTSLYVHFHDHDVDGGTLTVSDPDGTPVRRVDFEDDLPAAQDNCFLDTLYVSRPATGEWSVEVSGSVALDVEVLMVDTEDDIPDPREAWDGDGFEQREYEVNPIQFFDDLEPFIEDDGTLEGIGVDDVASGALDGYDQVVISHSDGLDDDAYVSALESFVEDGGDVVLTDTGVHALGALEAGSLSEIDPENVRDVAVNFVLLDERRFNHPLLAGIEPGQREIWKGPQVGYTTATDQPATVVDDAAFGRADGAIAGRIEGDASAFGVEPGEEITGEPGVGAGTFTVGDAEVTVIGSILPPANQEILHPFGIADYSLSFMGHTMLHNALGFVQKRIVDGEVIRTYGGADRPSLATYENEAGVVDGDGLREAVQDWRTNVIDTETLRAVVDAWQ